MDLLSAGEWLFDSYAGTNQALQMVKAMTVLEILYGGEAGDENKQKKRARSELSTTDLIANRVAYSLGKKPADRERYIRKFKALYDACSRILHAGMRRLDEQTQLEDARHLAKQAIRRELQFLFSEEPI